MIIHEIEEQYLLAERLINDYCISEFGYEADFSNIEKIGVAYTTTEDERHEIQVYVNLKEFKLETYFDNHLIDTEQYESLENMNESCLSYLSFDELVYIPDRMLEELKNADLSKENKSIYDINENKNNKKEEKETRWKKKLYLLMN